MSRKSKAIVIPVEFKPVNKDESWRLKHRRTEFDDARAKRASNKSNKEKLEWSETYE